MVSTYTGSENNGYLDGSLNNALFSNPWAIHIKNNVIYISEGGSDKIRKIDTNLNTNDFNLEKFAVYPNPNNGSFEISLENECSITIYNFIGKKVYFENNIIDNKIINTNLPKGIYIIEIKDNIEKSNFIKMIIK